MLGGTDLDVFKLVGEGHLVVENVSLSGVLVGEIKNDLVISVAVVDYRESISSFVVLLAGEDLLGAELDISSDEGLVDDFSQVPTFRTVGFSSVNLDGILSSDNKGDVVGAILVPGDHDNILGGAVNVVTEGESIILDDDDVATS